MPYISKSSIQELNDRLDAGAVFSEYLHLEKRGGRLWACCPFHQEKTASFTVNPDLKTYYCFGCHKGGTFINFVMEMEKITFPEAIELLAKRASVELVYENSGGGDFSVQDEEKKKKKEELFELYHRISGTFHHFLLKKPEARDAMNYIISRGISSEMIERFGLGYAPMERYWLHTFLSGKGYSKEFLSSSGLFSSRDARASLFSGRLMFPIKDRRGRTAAFGGRYLPGMLPERSGVKDSKGWEPPKYINSPELGIYKKGETLYALDLAMSEIRRTKTAYIAEGYLDVIALHQAGIGNAIAPLGTAFTDEQAKLLARWIEKLVFFFDSDEAGQAAVQKGIYTCRKNGLACAVVASVEDAVSEMNLTTDHDPSVLHGPTRTNSKDPADLLKNSGSEVLQKRAKNIIGDFDFLLNRARSLYGISSSKSSSAQQKTQGVAFLFPYVELLNSEVARTQCIEAAADALGLLPQAVADDYRRYASDQNSAERKFPGPMEREAKNAGLPVRMNEELSLVTVAALDYISASQKDLFTKFRSALEISDMEDQNAREIFIALEECLRYGEGGMDELLARIPSPELKKFIVERSVSGEFSANPEQFVDDGIKKMRRKGLEHRQEEIILKLRSLKTNVPEAVQNSEDEGDETYGFEIHELLAEKMQIDDELHQLKQGRLP